MYETKLEADTGRNDSSVVFRFAGVRCNMRVQARWRNIPIELTIRQLSVAARYNPADV